MSCTDVVEVNRIEDLQSYHLAWSALHAETPGATFFQTLEWLTAYWRHQGKGRRLRVLIVRSEGKPIGIVPLCEQNEVGHLGPVTVLTYPLDEWGASFGPIGRFATATLALAMRHIANTPRTWDVFEPRWTAHHDHDHGRTERAMRLVGLEPELSDDWQTSVIDCGSFADWDSYLSTRSSKTRHELRRQRRQLDRTGVVEHLHYRPEPIGHGGGDPRWDLFDHCVAISRVTWQATSRTGNTICNAAVQPMVRDAHEQAARLGMLDLHLLTVDGGPAAFFYGYHCGGRTLGLRMGYDPSAPKGSGAVLFGRVIERAFDLGDESIDLGVGSESYKTRFRTSLQSTTRLTHIPPLAWRPRAVSLARRAWRRVTQAG
ncbi:MAG: GNAT family N-acetyltransferase [Planctomycetota bacterium]